MGVRSGAAVAFLAAALVGFTVALPQDASLGAGSPLSGLLGRGASAGDGLAVGPGDADLGKALDRIDGQGLDPGLARNLDPEALAELLDGLTPEQLAALGLGAAEAAGLAARLRDPALGPDELAAIAAGLAARGVGFVNADGNARFDAGEAAYADLDGDGAVSVGDLRLGLLALLAANDRGLDGEARALLEAYRAAGLAGLQPPPSAAARDTATAATAPLAAAGFPSDRGAGPLFAACVPLYSLSLTCHTRTAVHGAVDKRGAHYLFALDAAREPVPTEPAAPGVRSSAALQLALDASGWTPVPGLTPQDRLVARSGDASVQLARDGNGMLWARGPPGAVRLDLTWAVDLSYFDLDVPAGLRYEDVPAPLRPRLEAQAQAVGLHLAELAGAQDLPYGDAVRALVARVRGFGTAPLPDRDERSDDLLAVMESQSGCARQRAQAFTLAAQSLGVPARLVLNEAHAFAEVYVPGAGWRMADLGACGTLEVAPLAHDEVGVPLGLPFAAADAPANAVAAGDGAPPATATAIDITESPAALRRNSDFNIAGRASGAAGPLPAGIPVTFTYNRTKDAVGTPFCSAATEAGGDYRATCRLGADAPAGSLQLVARLAPSAAQGRATAPAWSDPPFTLQKSTSLRVTGPARTSADVPVAYGVRLLDEDGAAVPQRTVRLRVDGGAALEQRTDGFGQARFPLQLALGAHTLAASFAGDEAYDPSAGSRDVQATALRLTAQVDEAALDGGALVLDGRAAKGQAAQAGATLIARWRDTPDSPEQTQSAVTDASGAFRVRFDGTPRPGPGLVEVSAADGTAVGLPFARAVEASVALSAPPRWQAGPPLPVTLQVGGVADPVALRVLVDGQVAAEAQAGPGAATVAVAVPSGRHTLTVAGGAGVHARADPLQVLVGRHEAAVRPIPTLRPGDLLQVSGTVRFDGAVRPMPLRLRLADAATTGQSDALGEFSLSLHVPPGLPPGAATAVLESPAAGFQQAVEFRLQRPARVEVQVPSLSLQAFGATQVAVRGEGTLRVLVDGEPAGAGGGDLRVPTATPFLRLVTVEARSEPDSPGLVASSAAATILVVNPVSMLAAAVLLGLLPWAAVRVVRSVRRRRERRNRFLPLPPRLPVRVLHPRLPRRVPLVVDPALDRALVLQAPRGDGWALADGLGKPVAARVEGRRLTILLDGLQPGHHRLSLRRGRRVLAIPCTVRDLGGALEAATRALWARLGRDGLGLVALGSLEEALAQGGAAPADARAVREAAERALYARQGCDRAAFHAYFLALDAAQSRKPAKADRGRRTDEAARALPGPGRRVGRAGAGGRETG